jgi:hypothetical protein
VDDRLRRLRSKSPSYGGDSRGGSNRRSRPNSPAYFESGDVKRQRGVDAALEEVVVEIDVVARLPLAFLHVAADVDLVFVVTVWGIV